MGYGLELVKIILNMLTKSSFSVAQIIFVAPYFLIELTFRCSLSLFTSLFVYSLLYLFFIYFTVYGNNRIMVIVIVLIICHRNNVTLLLCIHLQLTRIQDHTKLERRTGFNAGRSHRKQFFISISFVRHGRQRDRVSFYQSIAFSSF